MAEKLSKRSVDSAFSSGAVLGSDDSYDPPVIQGASSQEIQQASASDNDLRTIAKEVKERYKSSNVLKIAIRPSTKDMIIGVEELHVPVILKKSVISHDLPIETEINPAELFKESNEVKKILLYGPPGVGKSTELKMWLHDWCKSEEGNPLQRFPVVFYLDAAELKSSSSLGDAIMDQCLAGNTTYTAAFMEDLCRKTHNETLVILDNYISCMERDQSSDTTPLFNIVHLKDFLPTWFLVASTSGNVPDFRRVYGNYNHVRVDGISEESGRKYVQQLFKKRGDVEFAPKVLEFIGNQELWPDLSALPVLLSMLCQLGKWHEVPIESGGLKTTSALIGKIMECATEENIVMKHDVRGASDQHGPQSYDHSTSTNNEAGGEEANDEGCTNLPSLKGELSPFDENPSTEIFVADLAHVAFNCYLRERNVGILQLSQDDFDVCESRKRSVLNKAYRLGFIFTLGEDVVNPTTFDAAQGKVIKFLSPLFQQYLAAKHFSNLLESGNRNTFLQRIKTADDALERRNLLKFTCGATREAARQILNHVVKLTQDLAVQFNPDPREEDGVLHIAHYPYQHMVEFILELNYEAQSEGHFNTVLRPLLTCIRALEPSAVLVRALSYFLEYTAPKYGHHLHNIGIEIFDAPPELELKVPSISNIVYKYIPQVRVQVKEQVLVSTNNPSTHVYSSLMSIKVNQTSNETGHISVTDAGAARDLNASGDTGRTTHARENPISSTSPLPVSAEHDGGSMVADGKAERVIPKIKQELIQIGDKPVAVGRFSEVFKATYQGNTYALKRISLDSGKLGAALKEIKLNGLISHPNIVPLHYYTEYQLGNMTTCRVELLMDYISGCTLQDAIFNGKVKYLESTKGQVELALKVSDAIAHIHANKFTHSDIKPSNILIELPDNKPYVCDFGLGHGVTHSALSRITPGIRYGVQRWFPPEASSQGYKVTYGVDIWSLAATLLEVFTRRVIWEDFEHDWQLINRLKEDDVEPKILSLVQSESIKDVLRRCFVKNQEERPEARVLVNTFKEALSDL